MQCTRCEASFGFSAACYSYGVGWEEVKEAVENYREEETDAADDLVRPFKCTVCQSPLECAGLARGTAPLARWERGDNINPGCARRAYSAAQILRAKVKRKRVVQANACETDQGAGARRERRRRRLDDIDLNNA